MHCLRMPENKRNERISSRETVPGEKSFSEINRDSGKNSFPGKACTVNGRTGIGMDSMQLRAVTFPADGPLLVLAGPGAGKTFTMTHRILYLMQEKGVPPEQILAMTFAKEAAMSMEKRFHALCEANLSRNSYKSVTFGTFHSVFYHILRQSSDNHFQLISEQEKHELLNQALLFVLPESTVYERETIWQDVGDAISYYKNTGQHKGAFLYLQKEVQDCFEQIYNTYEQLRIRRRLLDFDDMLMDCLQLLRRDTKVRSYWQNRFRHILLDEFQDINPVQYELVKLIAAPPYVIFAVGDDDQSIYGFRGSEPACMKRFIKEFRAKQILLGNNYRSTPEIVEASLHVIGDNQDRFVKSLQAASSERGEVRIYGFERAEEEYAYLLKRCREEGDMAVLFRTNKHLHQFQRRLKAEGLSGKVHTMTVHAAKGLEFRTVILPHCNDHVYPYGISKKKTERKRMKNITESFKRWTFEFMNGELIKGTIKQVLKGEKPGKQQMLHKEDDMAGYIEEERRVFYVGMTRAAKCLEILYVDGKKGENLVASPFLNRKLLKTVTRAHRTRNRQETHQKHRSPFRIPRHR